MTKLNPYISFKNNAREAMEFYHSVFGGKLTLNTFKEFQASVNPDEDNLIMHGAIETDNLTLMGADTPSHMEYKEGTRINISLSGDNESELRGYWDKLANGATITQPLEKAPWGDSFGILVDKFGVQWFINIIGPKA